MFSFGLKNAFPSTWMKGSLKNICGKGIKWFPLAIKSVSTQKNNSLIAGIEDSLENTFPLQRKTVLLLARKSKKTISTNRKCFSFKLVPSNFYKDFQQQGKSSELKHTAPTRQKVFTSQNEGFLEKCIFTSRKSYF